jgi:pilus assembly protein Flp/PilA
MGHVTRFFKDEEGATAIEYGLLAALISIAAIATMTAVGTSLTAKLGQVDAALQ